MKKSCVILCNLVVFLFNYSTIQLFNSSTLLYAIETYDFLRIPNAPRYSGMGRCNVGMLGDPLAVFVNPAGIQNIGNKWASAYTHYIEGIHSGCITKTFVPKILKTDGTMGIGINYWNFGGMDEYDINRDSKGTFTPQCLIPTLAYSRTVRDLSLGANLKLIYQTIEDFTSTAIATDIGFFIPLKKMKGLTIGGTVQNLGMQLSKFDETEEKLPTGMRIGGVYHHPRTGQFSVEMSLPEKDIFAGAEIQASQSFVVRGGYYSSGSDIETGRAFEILRGLTLGIGFKTSSFLVDYALVPMAELGLIHQLSLTFLPVPKKTADVIYESPTDK